MKTIACRSCGARIGFIDLPSGKKMPVDPELVKTFVRFKDAGVADPPRRPIVLVSERGFVARGWETSLTDPDGEAFEGYQSHFATCTDPQAHRR